MKTIFLIIASIIVALVLGEVVVRVSMKENIVLFPRYHTDANYGPYTLRRIRPDAEFWHQSIDGRWFFDINKKGLRNYQDFDYSKADGVMRIIVLGDSHTEGFEVRQDHTFSYVLGEILRARGIHAEVINAGISGFSTAEELAYLENEGVKYHPDVVVLGFYANDFEDNLKADLFGIKDGVLVKHKLKHIPGVKILNVIDNYMVFRWLGQHSYLYSFVFNSVWNIAKRNLTTSVKQKISTEYAVATHSPEKYEKELMTALLERLRTFSKKNKMKLYVIDIPKVSEQGQIHSSIPNDLLSVFRKESNLLWYAPDALSGFLHVSDILHLPHGHRHISEITHALIARDIATAVMLLEKVE